MLTALLRDRTRKHIAEEREWLSRLQQALARFDVPAEERSALERSIAQLDRLFLLVVIGEFNAGKSAFVNALVGARVLEEGVTPTTTTLQILQFGDVREQWTDTNGAAVIAAPVPLLRDLNIVDTPGTNAIFREHERLTSEFVPQADLVLFVTSADRPFTESERAFLEAIRNWGKKIVIVINKVDLLEQGRSPRERHRARSGHGIRRRQRPPAARRLARDLPGLVPCGATAETRGDG
jgi:small GTP-binding protein